MRNILIVVDMQNDFIDGSLGTKEAQEIVTSVAGKIRNFEGDIYGTLDTHEEDYLSTQEGKTQQEIAKIFHISQVQVSRIEKRILKKLRRQMIGNI